MTDSPAYNPILTPAGRIAAILRQDIHNGKYAVGERLANERELAHQFAVSRGTLRETLRILAAERLILRQQGRGTFVADPAYAPIRGEPALIGAMVYEKEYYFGGILQGASSQSCARGYILTTGSNATAELENQHLEAFLCNNIKGVILAPLAGQSCAIYDRFVDHNIPVVLLDSTLKDRDEDFVGVDDYRGAAMATQHLIELGHTRVAYVGGSHPERVSGEWQRQSGFHAACEQAQITTPRNWGILEDSTDHAENIQAALSLQERPTGIVAFNDFWAVRVIRTAQDMGLRVPQDLSVVGFDNSSIARNHDIPISSINPQLREQGNLVVDLLVEKIGNPHSRPKRQHSCHPNTYPPRVHCQATGLTQQLKETNHGSHQCAKNRDPRVLVGLADASDDGNLSGSTAMARFHTTSHTAERRPPSSFPGRPALPPRR